MPCFILQLLTQFDTIIWLRQQVVLMKSGRRKTPLNRQNSDGTVCVILILLFSLSAEALEVRDIVDRISQENYTSFLDNMLYTHTGHDRGYGIEHDMARDNIFTQFENFGLDTSFHSFEYSDSTYYNVVGLYPGSVRPDDIFIVGAHYDSVNNPGADDNASGTAGIMEMAYVLSQYEFEATLAFVAFDREEQGLWGSRAYAQDHSNDNILGMVSLDMIAYNPNDSDTVRIYGANQNAGPLKDALAEAVDLYSNSISPFDAGIMGRSDHEPFGDEGFQACLLIEYDVFDNPHYHQLSDSVDTLDYIDYAYATDIVRATTGCLATSAVLIPEPGALLLMCLAVLLSRRSPAKK
jgi:Peptidase family M28